jgi:hypothetical protein
LGRSIESDENDYDSKLGVVNVDDLYLALQEVRPALGKQDEVLKLRFPLGISAYSSTMKRIMRDLDHCNSYSWWARVGPVELERPPWRRGPLHGPRAMARPTMSVLSRPWMYSLVVAVVRAKKLELPHWWSEAKEMACSYLVLDDIDQLCTGSGPGGYSSVMIATLRALLRSPPSSTVTAGGSAPTKMGASGNGNRAGPF